MGPEDDVSQLTLAEFLVENEGRQCVVVLDEIEKTAKENLFSLLVPFELGRCPLESGRRHVDVRKVIWIATSNIGQETVTEYDESRPAAKEPMSRQEYLELTTILRDQVSTQLGASLLSRVTCVLPFVPFSEEERRAIAAESLMTLGGDDVSDLSLSAIDEMVDRALISYVPSEGARSLYRAVSSQLVDV
jgi:ATP-dependent Clp protease ATP-binding subunit ClpA